MSNRQSWLPLVGLALVLASGSGCKKEAPPPMSERSDVINNKPRQMQEFYATKAKKGGSQKKAGKAPVQPAS